MKITQGPTDRLVHCCDCGACSEQIDPIRHAQYCDGIRKEQQWETCMIYHIGETTVTPWKKREVTGEAPHGCRECGQAGTMVDLFQAEGRNIYVYRCGQCEALEISDGVAISTWYRPVAGI